MNECSNKTYKFAKGDSIGEPEIIHDFTFSKFQLLITDSDGIELAEINPNYIWYSEALLRGEEHGGGYLIIEDRSVNIQGTIQEHLSMEYQDGKFVIIDSSTDKTYAIPKEFTSFTEYGEEVLAECFENTIVTEAEPIDHIHSGDTNIYRSNNNDVSSILEDFASNHAPYDNLYSPYDPLTLYESVSITEEGKGMLAESFENTMYDPNHTLSVDICVLYPGLCMLG
jgi:hypothetical protein